MTQRGFTLLEVLVVLIIASLISVVLMQGLFLVLNLRDNLGDNLLDLDQTSLERSRALQPLEGLLPDFNDGQNQFKGTASTISGLTNKPLLRREGLPTPFSLSIKYDERRGLSTLVYQEVEDPAVVLTSWEGKGSRFRYIGNPGLWSESWPEESMVKPLGIIGELISSQLPELILIDPNSNDMPPVAVAILSQRVRMAREPPF